MPEPTGQRHFRPWLVGAVTAVLLLLPTHAVIIVGWFVRLPRTAAEIVWIQQDAVHGRGPPSVAAQALALVGSLLLAAIFGAAGAELRRRRGVHDRHPAAQTTRGGLAGFVVLNVVLALASNILFRGGRSLFYVAFGPGGEFASYVATLVVLAALVCFFSLARKDIWLGRLVWAIARIPPEAKVGGLPPTETRVWTGWRVAAITICFLLAWTVGVLIVPIGLRIGRAAAVGRAGWLIVCLVGSAVVASLVLSLCGTALLLGGFQAARAQEERAVVTRLRLGLLARRPILAALCVAGGVGIIGSLTMHSGVLTIIEKPMAGQLLAARSRFIQNGAVHLAPAPCFMPLRVFGTQPAFLSSLLSAEESSLVVIAHVSFEDMAEGASLVRAALKGKRSGEKVLGAPFDEQMRLLDERLQETKNIFFLVDGLQTDPRQYGAASARVGWFDAEGQDPEHPFHARLWGTPENEDAPSLPVLIAAQILAVPCEEIVVPYKGKLKIGPATVPLDDKGAVLVSGRRSLTVDEPGQELPPKLREQINGVLPGGGYVPVYVSSPRTISHPRSQLRLQALDATVEALVSEVLSAKAPELPHILTESRIIKLAPLWINLLILWGSCLWAALMATYFRPLYAAILTVYAMSIELLAVAIVVTLLDVLANPTVPMLAMLVVWAGGSHVTQALVERGRDVVRSVFGRYVTQQVADDILSREETALGGELRKVTVLFADIRGFGRIAEKLDPETVVALLNDYFSVIVDVVFEYEGTLDKFIGDAVMAVWGAPMQHPDDAANAVRAAVAIRDRINELGKKRTAEAKPVVEVAVGLNTGEVVAGNIGDIRRMEYTVIGDEVVVAARLQELASQGPSYIIISESTYDQVQDLVEVRPLGSVQVRHREKPVEIYELIRLH